MTKTDSIFYVTPINSWEAEVLIPNGEYIYGGHFIVEMPFYSSPNYIETDNKTFLIVIIKKIEKIRYRKMNKIQFNKFIKEVYDNILEGVPRITDGSSSDSSSDKSVSNPPPLKRIRLGTKKKSKKRKHKKKGKKGKKDKKDKKTKNKYRI